MPSMAPRPGKQFVGRPEGALPETARASGGLGRAPVGRAPPPGKLQNNRVPGVSPPFRSECPNTSTMPCIGHSVSRGTKVVTRRTAPPGMAAHGHDVHFYHGSCGRRIAPNSKEAKQ